jgi:transcriptional regulator with PAS, ATPase and Fis domain
MKTQIYHIFDDSIQNLSELKNFIEILKNFLDEAYEGIIILDEKGYVQYTNKKHAEYLKIPQKTALHAHITEITHYNPAKDFLKVLRTGEPELRKIIQAHGREFVANQVPLKKEGKVIGAAGIILFDIKEVDAINRKIIMLENQLRYYKEQLKTLRSSKYSFEDIVGESEIIKKIKKEAQKAAKTDANVLLIGESGTGKELFAHAIHNQSLRRFGPFVRVNCSAIPRELLESELFGYEPGSFTGARKNGKKGKFELASKGSIFLDEIGDMPLQMQGELLRVLQEKEVDRIGGTRSISVDFRLIAATNKNLEEMIKKGLFRKDLFYRLNVVRIELPPLKKRIEDIPILAEYFLKQKAKEIGLEKINLSPKALKVLQSYDYPGNIRELINILERVVSRIDLEKYTNREFTITRDDINSVLNLENFPKESFQNLNNLKKIKHDQEIRVLKETIRLTGGNLTKCAKILGIHRTSIHRKIKLYNLYSDVLLARKKHIESIISD